MKVDPQELQPLFRQTTFERGVRYAEEGHVLELLEDVSGRRVGSRVRGRNPTPYRTRVDLARSATGRLVVRGSCDCPVGYNCKHVVATLWVYANQTQDADQAPPKALIDRWLSNLADSASGRANSQLPVEAVLYPLVMGRDGDLDFAPMRARRNKSGGWLRPRPFALLPDSYAGFVNDDDRHIALAVREDNVGRIGGGIQRGTTLDAMINTGRTILNNDPEQIVAKGAPVMADLSWHLDTDGTQRLTVKPRQPVQVLPVNPPWYLDAAERLVGSLEIDSIGDFSLDTLSTLLSAPPIPPDRCEEVSRQLSELPGAAEFLPPLRAFNEQYLPKALPVPQLRISSQLDEGSGADDWEFEPWEHLLSLSFLYGDERVGPDLAGDQVISVHADERVIRPRDVAYESQVVEMIEDMGFNAVSEDDEASLFEHFDGAVGWLSFFEEAVPELREAGWQIEVEDQFQLNPVKVDDWYLSINEPSGEPWFELELGIEIDGEQVSLLPVLLDLLSVQQRAINDKSIGDDVAFPVVLPGGGAFSLSMGRIRSLFATLVELFDKAPDTVPGPGADRLRLPTMAAPALLTLDGGGGDKPFRWYGGEALKRTAERLANVDGVRDVSLPVGLKASLRDYQQYGFNWLQFLREFDLGGVLADDMGLGKTIQTLAHVLCEKEAGRLDRPALVIAPTSLMHNWRNEAKRFAPGLNVLILHGPQRKSLFPSIDQYDLVLTTYPLLARDFEALADKTWHLLILDEAQTIKNPGAKATQAVKALNARHRLCLTGTPMENHLGELWSLFDFLLPGYLGDLRQFTRQYRKPIERGEDLVRRDALRRRVGPFMLRRTKTQVAMELPDKTEIIQSVPLSGKQRDLYETVRLSMDARVRDEIRKRGLSRSHIVVLDALLKLRQICCDPRLLPSGQGDGIRQSAKLELLMELLPEMVEEGRRILVFSQFTSMLAIIEQEVKKQGLSYVKLTGNTRNRGEVIDRFQSGEVSLFLISLKAGGVGLNLTAADTVIHYDPWWNPAVERQATDRAHRIGQDKPVFVYKLLTDDTVEARIAEMQEKKAALAESLFSEAGEGKGVLQEGDLEALFQSIG